VCERHEAWGELSVHGRGEFRATKFLLRCWRLCDECSPYDMLGPGRIRCLLQEHQRKRALEQATVLLVRYNVTQLQL